MLRRQYCLLGLIAFALVGCNISDGVAPSPIARSSGGPQQDVVPEDFRGLAIVNENGTMLWVDNVMTIGFGPVPGSIVDCAEIIGLMDCTNTVISNLIMQCLFDNACNNGNPGPCGSAKGYPFSGIPCYGFIFLDDRVPAPAPGVYQMQAKTTRSTTGMKQSGGVPNVPIPNGTFYIFDRWITTTPCAEGTQTGLTCTFTFTVAFNFVGWKAVAVYRTTNYAFGGFLDPVSSVDLNIAKAGSSVPVKFSLGGAFGLGILAENSPSSQQVTCQAGVSTSSVDATSTAGSSGLSYDATNDRYTYVWKTQKAWAGSCREFTLTLLDGSTYIALFQFLK